MITIDLEDTEDATLVRDNSEEPKETPKEYEFKRKLIFQVRKHPVLYDCHHKNFSNVLKKDIVWQKIAEKLNSNVDDCKETWFQLRYKYQWHARRLRNFFIQGHKENRKRPAMALEVELMFLWRVVDDRKTCKVPFEIPEDENPQPDKKASKNANQTPIDDDLILVEPPVELIVIDEDDDIKSEKQFKLSPTMKTLIPLVKVHRELYDSKHKDFSNYTRKSFLWNSIASTMGDKATKLMKCWIVMQTRYEWEICQQKQAADSELLFELGSFREFIVNNPDTVYKQSYFLKSGWHDPIDYFKDIYNLIVRMKKMSDIVYITDSLLKTPEKSKQYLSLWTEVANLKNCSPGQCETTWLIMRHFYWELMNMRKENYQLTDKWYFETIITELYAISKAAQTTKQQELQVLKSNKQSKKATKRSAQTNATTQGAPPNKHASPISAPTPAVTAAISITTTPTIHNFQNASATNSTLTTQSTTQPTLTLPKITAAISLAPQSLNSGSLQIKQISGPPALSPAPFQLNNNNNNNTNNTNATVTSPSIALPTQLSMSFNLPTQTKVTPITMPALIRSVAPNHSQQILRSNTPATISLRPAQPQIQIASWATAPRTSLHANVITEIHNSLQPPAPRLSTRINSFTPPQIPATIQPVSATTPPPLMNSILGSQMPYNQQNMQISTYNKQNTSPASSKSLVQPSIVALPLNTTTSYNNNNLAPPESSPIQESNSPPQFPKITGAVSLLNPNEILIELISSHSGNQLVVHGPALSAKYQLTMPTVSKFIREVLAIPVLHTKQPVQTSLINYYWDHISNTSNMPVHICRAVWNFLLENFEHFPQISSMKELMKPFQTTIKVWTEKNELFQKFDKMSTSKGWIKYSKSFPDVVECIGGYPVLYQDVAKEKRNEELTDMESLCIWRTIGLRFPKNSDIQEIWVALKACFLQYMSDLEIGIDNKWPINWWRSLARMKFLVEAKYSTSEPFYYIITNKMLEEIDKFATMEMKNRSKIEENSVYRDDETKNIEMEIAASVISTREKSKEVEMIALLTAIQKYPCILAKTNNLEKQEAWEKVAEELRMEVPDCLFAFRDATEKYLTYKKRDPVNRLHINEKYYKKFDEIISSLPSNKLSLPHRSKINIKTPFELNQSPELDNSSDLVFPERFISDINMSNSSSNLVVKNWIYALGNIPNESLNTKLKRVLKKYLTNIK